MKKLNLFTVFFLQLLCLFGLYSNTLLAQENGTSQSKTLLTKEEMPIFSDEKGLEQFVIQNTHYPTNAKETKIQGTVVSQFVIETNGKVSSPKIIRGLSPGIDEEVLRMIQSMPAWIPAKQDTTKIITRYKLPIRFSTSSPNIQVVIDSIVAYKVIRVMPSFPGGYQALFRFLGKNIRYPKNSRKNNSGGTGIVGFTIEVDGSVGNVKVVQGIDPDINQEMVRVVKSMPKWKPGTSDGEPVRVVYSIPIRFTLNRDLMETPSNTKPINYPWCKTTVLVLVGILAIVVWQGQL